jgi:hypothetical protein
VAQLDQRKVSPSRRLARGRAQKKQNPQQQQEKREELHISILAVGTSRHGMIMKILSFGKEQEVDGAAIA